MGVAPRGDLRGNLLTLCAILRKVKHPPLTKKQTDVIVSGGFEMIREIFVNLVRLYWRSIGKLLVQLEERSFEGCDEHLEFSKVIYLISQCQSDETMARRMLKLAREGLGMKVHLNERQLVTFKVRDVVNTSEICLPSIYIDFLILPLPS